MRLGSLNGQLLPRCHFPMQPGPVANGPEHFRKSPAIRLDDGFTERIEAPRCQYSGLSGGAGRSAQSGVSKSAPSIFARGTLRLQVNRRVVERGVGRADSVLAPHELQRP
jgi:hypothetical protein